MDKVCRGHLVVTEQGLFGIKSQQITFPQQRVLLEWKTNENDPRGHCLQAQADIPDEHLHYTPLSIHSPTQDGHDHVPSENLDGSPGDEVEGSEDVAGVHQRIPRWRMCGLELHGQGTETTLGGALEGFTVLKQCAIQVEADVCLQALREPLQHLVRCGARLVKLSMTHPS